MLAIFYTEKEASDFSNKIHDYLKTNRHNYTAVKWSDINRSDKLSKWCVKIPDDYQKWNTKLTIDAAAKEIISTESSKSFIIAFKNAEIAPISIKK